MIIRLPYTVLFRPGCPSNKRKPMKVNSVVLELLEKEEVDKKNSRTCRGGREGEHREHQSESVFGDCSHIIDVYTPTSFPFDTNQKSPLTRGSCISIPKGIYHLKQ